MHSRGNVTSATNRNRGYSKTTAAHTTPGVSLINNIQVDKYCHIYGCTSADVCIALILLLSSYGLCAIVDVLLLAVST